MKGLDPNASVGSTNLEAPISEVLGNGAVLAGEQMAQQDFRERATHDTNFGRRGGAAVPAAFYRQDVGAMSSGLSRYLMDTTLVPPPESTLGSSRLGASRGPLHGEGDCIPRLRCPSPAFAQNRPSSGLAKNAQQMRKPL